MAEFLTEKQAEAAWRGMASVLREIGAVKYLADKWLCNPKGLKAHFVNVWTGRTRKSEAFFLASAGISKLYPFPPDDEDKPYILILRQPDRYDDIELEARVRERIAAALAEKD